MSDWGANLVVASRPHGTIVGAGRVWWAPEHCKCANCVTKQRLDARGPARCWRTKKGGLQGVGVAGGIIRALIATGCRNGSKNASFKIREGEGGCLFDATQCRVEPPERHHKDVVAGPQRGRSRSVAVGPARLTRRCRPNTGKCEQVDQDGNTTPLTGRRLNRHREVTSGDETSPPQIPFPLPSLPLLPWFEIDSTPSAPDAAL